LKAIHNRSCHYFVFVEFVFVQCPAKQLGVNNVTDPMNEKLLCSIRNPFWFAYFLLLKLPVGLLTGLKLKEVTAEKAVVCIKYQWINKNPFHSIYFGCLAMAAELASGTLGLVHTMGLKPNVSVLVVHMEADFVKKGRGRVYFTCADGALIAKAVQEAKQTGEPTRVVATSVGLDENGKEIATFRITWSFKAKS
jgi:hypothetical protein